jgi:gluconolactonase
MIRRMGDVFEVFDERFEACFKASARLDRLFDRCRWAEGPAYFPAHRYLVWSDIPNDRMLRYDEASETVGVFRAPAGYSNGNAVDGAGRLLTCEHGGRRVSRTELDGSVTTLAERYEGKRLNSPNDLVARRDGTIYFSDPAYGIDSDYEGHKAVSELGACHLFRLAPDGALTIAADGFARPNGVELSPAQDRLYVSDTGVRPSPLRVFDVAPDGTLSGGVTFATCGVGCFDGFRCDSDGRIWTSSGDGVHCYDPDGALLGKIRVPEVVANVCFGGPKRNRLYICATTSLYAILLTVNGARTP